MNITKYIKLTAALAIIPMLGSCSEEKLGPTIFPEVPTEADPNSYTYKFDTWLNQNFRDIYNLDFKYKMEDVEADMNYNLVPATYENARDLSLLTKYLWFDSYKELVGEEFLKSYGPRILHLIGSPAYNPNTGTIILGLAEGGLKVSLFRVNDMSLYDINQLNEYYFRTMHHEFGHILHQTKSYPVEFNTLSTGLYDDSSWQKKKIGYVASLGFITPYASSQAREDFAETIANYLTRSDDAMELIKWMASQGWSDGNDDPTEEPDPSAEIDYYCRYYIKDKNKPEDKTYFLKAEERDYTNRPVVYGEKGEAMYTVAQVEAYLENFAKTHEVTPVSDDDKRDGLQQILTKQQIVREWFRNQWGLDFDKLREIVQRRQSEYDIDKLRQEIDAIPDPVIK